MSEIRLKVYDMLEDITGEDGLRENEERDLLETNILDSLSFILLLERLDDELGLEIQPTRVDPQVWRCASSIADYVEKLIMP